MMFGILMSTTMGMLMMTVNVIMKMVAITLAIVGRAATNIGTSGATTRELRSAGARTRGNRRWPLMR